MLQLGMKLVFYVCSQRRNVIQFVGDAQGGQGPCDFHLSVESEGEMAEVSVIDCRLVNWVIFMIFICLYTLI